MESSCVETAAKTMENRQVLQMPVSVIASVTSFIANAGIINFLVVTGMIQWFLVSVTLYQEFQKDCLNQ